ncbi:MAG TPA: restriction endonuclease subunit S, partial [Nitrososphaeraceae archaeon]|nr:restriction endonuclease subunit S [Nitrososphaeraceae archaeon]
KKRLQDIARISKGKTPKIDLRIEEDLPKIPFIRVSDIIDGEINNVKMKYLSTKKYENLTSHTLSKQDILYTVTGTIGKVAITTEKYIGSIANSNIAILRIIDKSVDPDYLYLILSSTYFNNKIQPLIKNLIYPHLTVRDLGAVEIPIPPISVQNQIKGEVFGKKDKESIQSSISERVDRILSEFKHE